MVDALGSSEAIGMATNTTTSESGGKTAKFELGPNTRVITDDGNGRRARLRRTRPRRSARAHPGRLLQGRAKKSAETFVMIDGDRYSIPGDYATVASRRHPSTLLGRGSQCINTGGEKVYPEEVEECLKLHPDSRRRRRGRAARREVGRGDQRARRADTRCHATTECG